MAQAAAAGVAVADDHPSAQARPRTLLDWIRSLVHRQSISSQRRAGQCQDEVVAEDDVLVAGSIPLADLLAALRARRNVFHSEADLQHALAWEASLP